MLSDSLQKVKSRVNAHKSDLFIATTIFLVGMASFGLGRLSVVWPEKEPISISNQEIRISDQGGGKNNNSSSTPITGLNNISSQGKYVASRSGTAYHYPWCPGALKIKEENKVWFQTKEEAQAKGYKPAGNCQGL